MNSYRMITLTVLVWLAAGCEELGPESRGEISNTAVQSIAEARTCLPFFDIDAVKPVSPTTVEFVLRDGTRWHNELARACPSVTAESVLAVASETDGACEADQLLVLHKARRVLRHLDTCVLGRFEKL